MPRSRHDSCFASARAISNRGWRPALLSASLHTVVALGFVLLPDTAAACTYEPALLLRTAQVPQNGQLVAEYYCPYSFESNPPQRIQCQPSLRVLDASNQEVPGELTRADEHPDYGTYHFKPAAVLPVGASYRVVTDPEVTASDAAPQSFSVVAPLTPDATQVSATLTLYPLTEPVREACCEEGTSSCTGPLCLTLEGRHGASVHPELQIPDSQQGQWQTRVRLWKADGSEEVSAWGVRSLSTFEQQTEYCSAAELSSLVDGSIVQLEKQCVAHGALPDFGTRVEDLSRDVSRAGLFKCDYPRAGTERAWCEATRFACDSGITAKSCENYEQYCLLSGDVTSVEANGSDTEGSTLDPNASDLQGTDRSGGGCGFVPSGAASGGLSLGLGLGWLGLGWLVRRRSGRATR